MCEVHLPKTEFKNWVEGRGLRFPPSLAHWTSRLNWVPPTTHTLWDPFTTVTRSRGYTLSTGLKWGILAVALNLGHPDQCSSFIGHLDNSSCRGFSLQSLLLLLFIHSVVGFHYIVLAGLLLCMRVRRPQTNRNQPASAATKLGLKACTTTSGQSLSLALQILC